ncbi:MAG: 2-keto-3-deoxygluconate permease [Atopococcus tabaci]|uniref:2-keto-3-deoxygluconate permease n=1 Tax=Atopococcus tabaci TaxID=269774 RepID=A0AA43ZTK8_9LACT|nr:2-keto-3-deoxygluconate permease [Atopococcus tabaci]
MLKLINKVPAGMFVVPMVLSMILNTFWPDLFLVGGMTQSLFSGDGVPFMVAFLTFASGVSIKLGDIPSLLKRHGVLFLIKLIVSVALSVLYMRAFGQEGIFGISALGFTLVMTSLNPSVYLSVVDEYGDDLDPAAFGITAIFTLPLIPQIIYSLGYTEGGSGGGFDFTPILLTLIPLIFGMILGNIDAGFRGVFGPGLGAIIPVLGWGIGQSANIIDAFRSGLPGIIITLVFVIIYSSLFVVDKYVLKKNGITGLAFIIVAGTSAAAGPTITAIYPELLPYLGNAVALVVFAFIITSVATPLVIGWYHSKYVAPKEEAVGTAV